MIDTINTLFRPQLDYDIEYVRLTGWLRVWESRLPVIQEEIDKTHQALVARGELIGPEKLKATKSELLYRKYLRVLRSSLLRREDHLAYAFARGRPYLPMEQALGASTSPTFPDYTVARVLCEYLPFYTREMRDDRNSMLRQAIRVWAERSLV